jgi:hypothetical protein
MNILLVKLNIFPVKHFTSSAFYFTSNYLHLQAVLQKQPSLTNPIAIQFSKNLKTQIEKRFPNFGSDIKEFAIGNFLNPYYKGCFIRR